MLDSVDVLDRGERVFVYGSGAAGRALRSFLDHCGIPLAAFLDTRRTGSADGIAIVPIDSYLEHVRRPGDQILITSSHFRDIAAELARRSVDRVWNAARFSLSIGDHPGQFLRLVENGRIVLG